MFFSNQVNVSRFISALGWLSVIIESYVEVNYCIVLLATYPELHV